MYTQILSFAPIWQKSDFKQIPIRRLHFLKYSHFYYRLIVCLQNGARFGKSLLLDRGIFWQMKIGTLFWTFFLLDILNDEITNQFCYWKAMTTTVFHSALKFTFIEIQHFVFANFSIKLFNFFQDSLRGFYRFVNSNSVLGDRMRYVIFVILS